MKIPVDDYDCYMAYAEDDFLYTIAEETDFYELTRPLLDRLPRIRKGKRARVHKQSDSCMCCYSRRRRQLRDSVWQME